MLHRAAQVRTVGALALVIAGAACRRRPPPPPAPVVSVPRTGLQTNRFAGTPEAQWPDSAVRSAVEAAEADELGPRAAEKLGVEVKHGVVILSGIVDTLLAKKASVSGAESIRGVRSVIDEVTVETPRRTDTAIARDVRRSFTLRARGRMTRTKVAVSRGLVTLTGTVDSGQELRFASRLAAGVSGVRGVRNQVTVTPTRSRPDPEIIQDVQSRLRWSLPLDARLITVTSTYGRVILTGQVATPADRARAADLAWVDGVQQVDSAALAVDPADFPREPRSRAIAGASDASIGRAVRDALHYDPRVDPEDIGVDVGRSVVTLRGDPSTLAEKRAAIEDVHDTAGVERVEDLMTVHPSTRMTDREIAHEVRLTLAADPVLDLRGLAVTAAGGEVMLTGSVSSRLAHTRAVELASAAPGVRSVSDGILIMGRPQDARSGRRSP